MVTTNEHLEGGREKGAFRPPPPPAFTTAWSSWLPNPAGRGS
jgi:hypothetical protein